MRKHGWHSRKRKGKAMFKDVPGYEGRYQVDENGNVYSYRMKRNMKPGTYPNGYKYVCLCNGANNHKQSMIHRIVAKTFIPRIPGKDYVNHIDGNKQNNHVSNLEWVTCSENLRLAVRTGLVKSQCKICRKTTITKDGVTTSFDSMAACAKFFGKDRQWMKRRERKHNGSFMYQGYQISVQERRCAKKS